MNVTIRKEERNIGGLPATIEYTLSATSPFLLFVPGFPSHKDVGQNVEASEQIVQAGIASTFRYSSSRNWELWKEAEKAGTNFEKFEKQSATFSGKTYQQELEELRMVVDHINQEFCPAQLYLSGTSYGGGLAALLCGESIAHLSKVLLSCPQIEPAGREQWNCYRGFLPKEAFQEALARYQGKLRIIHSRGDRVVPFQQARELFDAATTNDKELISLPGGNHIFTGEARKEYVRQHLDFFRG